MDPEVQKRIEWLDEQVEKIEARVVELEKSEQLAQEYCESIKSAV